MTLVLEQACFCCCCCCLLLNIPRCQQWMGERECEQTSDVRCWGFVFCFFSCTTFIYSFILYSLITFLFIFVVAFVVDLFFFHSMHTHLYALCSHFLDFIFFLFFSMALSRTCRSVHRWDPIIDPLCIKQRTQRHTRIERLHKLVCMQFELMKQKLFSYTRFWISSFVVVVGLFD